MNNLVLYYPDGHQKHELRGHPERPERIEAVRQGLQEVILWDQIPKLPPVKVPEEILTSVHTKNYLSSLEQACRQGQMLDLDTYTTPDSWQLALNAAGGALAIAKAIWDGDYSAGFALTRPPGHHATASRGMGFCLINNVAVAADYLINKCNAKHISILDIDLHHGNGTQDIFWQRSDVSYISIHQAPFYPGTGSALEIGEGEGEGYTLNLPIPAGSGDLAFQTLLEEIILPYLDDKQPELLLISMGFDTHWRDPLGSMLVSGAGFYNTFQTLLLWSESNCEGRIGVILEGGYDLEAGRVCGQAVGAGLVDREWEDPIGSAPDQERDVWRDTLQEVKSIWNY